MTVTEIVSVSPLRGLPAPALIAAAGEEARERFFEFFAAQIHNRNTRSAYLQAAHQFFAWGAERSLKLRHNSVLARHRLHRRQAAGMERALDQAASRRAAHAVQLAGARPGAAHQSGALREGAEVQP
jgi:hypothetical protein